MTLNPQRKLPDGVGEPYPGQTVNAVEAIRARQAAERAAERERVAELDAVQTAEQAQEVLGGNPEPAWQRLASWLR